MERPVIALHKDEAGKLSILEMGLDADPVLEAYKKCTKPGNTYLYHRVLPTKSKKLRSEPPKKAKKKVAKD